MTGVNKAFFNENYFANTIASPRPAKALPGRPARGDAACQRRAAAGGAWGRPP